MEISEKNVSTSENNLHNNNEANDKKLLKNDILPFKMHEEKNSILVKLSENKHAATVYNLFLTMLFSLFLKELIYNYLYNGEIKLGFNLLIKGYSKLHVSIAIWLGMFAASFLCFYGFQIWALHRTKLLQKCSKKVKVWDRFMIGLVIIYYTLFLYYPPLFITRNDIPIAASVTLLSDNLRMLMVFHSFIRTNAKRVVRNQKEHKSIVVPGLSNFLYFYFAPTLIYKDVYPRSSQSRNWKVIFGYVVEFFGAVLLMSYLFEGFFLNQFEDFGLRPYSGKEITMIFFNKSMIGLLLFVSIFYAVMHAWMNMFAELMKFSDRTFYKDWWTSTTFERHYRTSNVVVHDWLYTYIYKEFYENVYSKSKFPAKLMVFIISAAFHEYILGFSFRVCLPILSLKFLLVGLPFMKLRVKPHYIGNALYLYELGIGATIIITIHTMEYYSRINCLIEHLTVYDYFVPHLFSCNK